MSIRSTRRGRFLIFTVISAVAVCGRTPNAGSAGGAPLTQRYNDAHKLQQAGHINEAVQQYRAFLADALGELAIGYGLARDYAHAAPLFDEALTLEPNSPSLSLEYARTALVLGDLDHAKTLATDFIRKYPGDREELAQAHQVLGRTLLKLDRDQEARKEFEAAVALDPTFPNGYDLAVACLDLDDEECAVQLFQEMQTSFGDTPEIHMSFGRAYASSDFEPHAVAEFRRAIEENPRLPGAHYLLAAVLLATGNDEQHVNGAEMALREELVISPGDSMTYAALGRIAASRNQYGEAEGYLKKATSFGPQNPDAYLILGQMYFSLNRSAEAEAALRQCIRLTTDVSRNRYQIQKAHFLLGRILMQKGERDAAHAQMEIARELANKTLAQDKNKLAGLMDTSGDHDVGGVTAEDRASPPIAAAIADPVALRKIETPRGQVNFAIADSYRNLGSIAATNGDYSGAVIYFERAALWNPSLEGLDYEWGRAAFAASQFGDAIMSLSRYLKSHPDDTGARSVLSISQFMAGKYHDCIETMQPAIGKDGLAPQAEYVYAESMIMSGQIAAGTERLTALEKSHPAIPDVHRALGEVLGRQGERQRALEELHTAIDLSPRDGASHYDLGKMELESGDTAGAIAELETAVRLSPESEKFHQELADAYSAALRTEDAHKEMAICNVLRSRVQSDASSRHAVSPEQ